MWEEVTVPVFPSGLRYRKAGPNAHFLDASHFIEHVLPPYEDVFRDYTGPFIFEFQRVGIERDEFLPRLDAFLSRLPPSYEYAVEVRTPAVLCERYRDILAAHGVAHVYNHWTSMPALLDQPQRLSLNFTAPFTLLRLLTARHMKHGDAVKVYEPYDRLVRPLPSMRADTIRLIRQAAIEQRRAYVLVNNRTEGHAPLTIQALVDELRSGDS